MDQRTGFDAGFEFGRRHRNNPLMHWASWVAIGAHSVAAALFRVARWVAYAVGFAFAVFLTGAIVNDMLTWNWSGVGSIALLVAAAVVGLVFILALVRGAIVAAPVAILFAIVGGFCAGGVGAVMGAAAGGLVGLLGLGGARRDMSG
jgi:hypothetical protein